MTKKIKIALLLLISVIGLNGQTIKLKNQEFELKNVTGSVVDFQGEKVLKIERDLKALPFDMANLASTVDEPTYAKLLNLDFENGVIEVKMLSQIQDPSPFQGTQGFIGIAFRINDDDSAYESIYLRPRGGRSDNQLVRNKTVQYYSYPDYKFDRLRKEADGMYEYSQKTEKNHSQNHIVNLCQIIRGQNCQIFCLILSLNQSG